MSDESSESEEELLASADVKGVDQVRELVPGLFLSLSPPPFPHNTLISVFASQMALLVFL